MPRISFANTGQSFEVGVGTTILECAVENKIPLEHACGGNCACTTCEVSVERGMECVSTMGADEKSLLQGAQKLDEKTRLACQLKVTGPGEVIVRYP